MPRKKKTGTKAKANDKATADNIGYEAEPWKMADALRGSMDAAEYKRVLFGLFFLEYGGRVDHPDCGASGMVVQSVRCIPAHENGDGGKAKANISIYANYTILHLANMNLAIRGVEGQVAPGATMSRGSFSRGSSHGVGLDQALANLASVVPRPRSQERHIP